MIKLYTIDCPKCKVLETKLKSKNIDFEIVKDVSIMKDLGITTTPVLEVDGKLLNFIDAINYVNGRE